MVILHLYNCLSSIILSTFQTKSLQDRKQPQQGNESSIQEVSSAVPQTIKAQGSSLAKKMLVAIMLCDFLYKIMV